MKNVTTRPLAIPDIKVIRYERFADARGYFTESFRKSDLVKATAGAVGGWEIVQANESFSRKGTVRGLHFQWNPYMGKLVRTVAGRMIDIVLDIRLGSPHFGRAIAYDLPADTGSTAAEWIWVPPGFAHGNFFPEDTIIEYLCSGEYSGGNEAGISPLAADIDWSLCDPSLREQLRKATSAEGLLMTDKDRNGFTLAGWQGDERSRNFVHGSGV